MGANCCIAAKESSQPSMAPNEVSTCRVRHSPSWSFRWDNRTHIEDIMENSMVLSNQSSGNIHPEVKNSFIAPTGGHNSGDSHSDVLRRVKWQKTDKKMEASKLSKFDPPAHQSTAADPTLEANSSKAPDIVTASDIKTSESLPSTSPPVPKADSEDPSSSRSHSICIDPNSTREATQMPGHQLYRQTLDGNIPSLKLLSGNSSAERPSNSKLSACSIDMFTGQLQGETSDGWSTRTPSDLVATTERDRWSVDNGLLGSIASKTSRSNSSHPSALSPAQEVCKLCSRLLKERSSCNYGHELAVVAVLFCGHAYHANCLDSITAETEEYDPPCPVCTHGEACTAKLFGKMELKVKNKTSKNMADADLDGSFKRQKKAKREPRLGSSSSMKDMFSRPFLRRHFSTGSRASTPVSGSDPTRKKGFWSRHWRE